jgi:hypothetical protein
MVKSLICLAQLVRDEKYFSSITVVNNGLGTLLFHAECNDAGRSRCVRLSSSSILCNVALVIHRL